MTSLGSTSARILLQIDDESEDEQMPPTDSKTSIASAAHPPHSDSHSHTHSSTPHNNDRNHVAGSHSANQKQPPIPIPTLPPIAPPSSSPFPSVPPTLPPISISTLLESSSSSLTTPNNGQNLKPLPSTSTPTTTTSTSAPTSASPTVRTSTPMATIGIGSSPATSTTTATSTASNGETPANGTGAPAAITAHANAVQANANANANSGSVKSKSAARKEKRKRKRAAAAAEIAASPSLSPPSTSSTQPRLDVNDEGKATVKKQNGKVDAAKLPKQTEVIDLIDSDHDDAKDNGGVHESESTGRIDQRPTKQRRTTHTNHANGTLTASSAATPILTSPPVASPASHISIDSDSDAHDGDDGDVDLVGLSRELGVDLVTPPSASAPPLTPAPPPRIGLGEESMGGDGMLTGGRSSKSLRVRRYFDGEEDLSLKCFNCNEVGHLATNCPNSTVFKPCWLCGSIGHPSHRCTRDLCYRCHRHGHTSKECINKKEIITVCFWCGSTNHRHTECHSKSSVDLSAVRCYVCGERGHLNCAAGTDSSNIIVGSAMALLPITRVSCSNCGQTGHDNTECTEERMEMNLNVDNWGNVLDGAGVGASSVRAWQADMECFYCGKKGHLKFDCPKKKKDEEARWGIRRQGIVQTDRPGMGRRNNNLFGNSSSLSSKHRSPFSREGNRHRDRDRDFLHDRHHDRHSSHNAATTKKKKTKKATNVSGSSGRESRSREKTSKSHHRSHSAKSAPPRASKHRK